MKQIILKRIELTNFKGQAHRVETFGDGENFIIGPNGSGKTSVFDAFTWLLFGKDSKGQSEALAKVKMVDSNGEPVWHTDNKVEATFLVNGEELTLSRTYKEKWRKPKGSSEAVYDGQTTVLSWNGNEKISAAEYKKRVSELIDEELFKLITDPLYFATLKPEKRREIVISLAGNVDDYIVIASHPELQGFEVVGSTDEMKKVALSTKNKLIKERDNYPARIDELNQIITSIQAKEGDLVVLNDKIAKLAKKTAELQANRDKLSNVSSMVSDILSKNKERLNVLNHIEYLKAQKANEAEREFRKRQTEYDEYMWKIERAKQAVAQYDNDCKMYNMQLMDYRNKLKGIKLEIDSINAEEQPSFETAYCPTCMQLLPNQEEIQAETLEKWNADKREKLNSLQKRGNTVHESGLKVKDALDSSSKQLEEAKAELQALEDNKPLEPVRSVVDFSNDEEIAKLEASVPPEATVGEEVTSIESGIKTRISDLEKEIIMLEAQVNPLKHLKLQFDVDIPRHQERIDQLLKEQLEVNQQIADQERKIYLIDLFNKQKIEMMNNKVASNFDYVTFKMFNYTLEGNPVPTCEIIVNGVDYTALNTAGKMNAGLDIINALIKFYDVKAPIFIDNRESVTTIKAPDTQIINLKVAEIINMKAEG